MPHAVTHTRTHTEQEIKANSPAAMRSCKQLINNVYHSLGSPKKGEGLSDVKAPPPPPRYSFVSLFIKSLLWS
jgi:hypothetical protein